jgi:hypothetical protein
MTTPRASSHRSPPACRSRTVVRALDAAGVATSDLHRREATLDDVFLALTDPTAAPMEIAA